VSFRLTECFPAPRTARDAFFLGKQIGTVAPTHSQISGFVYARLDAGVKYAQVWLAGKARLEKFAFVLDVPGPAFLARTRGWKTFIPKSPSPTSICQRCARRSLRGRAATNAGATSPGDPLNLVVIENGADVDFVQ
jgi:hypothetical protein